MKPTWEPLYLRCNACSHVWQDWQPNGCRFEVWIANATALRCPKCRAEAKRLVMTAEVADESLMGMT